MHAGSDGGRVEDELEEEWNEVDWDEDGGTAAGGGSKQHYHCPGVEELHWEKATSGAGKDGEPLLKGKDDEEDTRRAEETYDLAAPPGVGGPAKVNRHDAGHHCAHHNDGADSVDLPEALAEGDTGPRVIRRKEEHPGGYEDGSNAQVDVKPPSPTGAAAGEGTCEHH